ncbi:MAG: helix-turn-helix transcriptional regulator [Planctomycetaceae bacterium]|nr:helix-turn-helix transcriptional regulator [Planctomycetaceae bacterium]
MTDFAHNVRRLLARQGLSVAELIDRAGLDERTVKNILNGTNSKPHARTLHQLALGLDVQADELFQNPALLARRSFDRESNPLVDEVIEARPELFDHWTAADFDELSSRFGAGGALTFDGALSAVEQMNARRELMRKVALVMESDQRDVLRGIVDVLYRQVVIEPPPRAPASALLRSAS